MEHGGRVGHFYFVDFDGGGTPRIEYRTFDNLRTFGAAIIQSQYAKSDCQYFSHKSIDVFIS
jgi:hypothetical protein